LSILFIVLHEYRSHGVNQALLLHRRLDIEGKTLLKVVLVFYWEVWARVLLNVPDKSIGYLFDIVKLIDEDSDIFSFAYFDVQIDKNL